MNMHNLHAAIAIFNSQASPMPKQPKERLRIYPGVTSGMILEVLKGHVAEECIQCLPTHFKDTRANLVTTNTTKFKCPPKKMIICQSWSQKKQRVFLLFSSH